MNPRDEAILRAYFRYEEAQRQRLWLARLLHPETFKWIKRGAPPPISATKRIRIEEMARLGFDEAKYQYWVKVENEAEEEMATLGAEHPLWAHLSRIKGFGPLTCAKFVAAGGDISRAPTCSSFWKGMGLDVLPNGTVPRRIRGRGHSPLYVDGAYYDSAKTWCEQHDHEALEADDDHSCADTLTEFGADGHVVTERRVPALPHVTRVGEQIRQQIMRGGGKLYDQYCHFRERYDAKYPTRAKMFNHKAAVRGVQKLLYALLWAEWRRSLNLPAPEPYAYDILKHDTGQMVQFADLYDKELAAAA